MTQNGKPSIRSGTACFLIKDDSLYEKYHAPFFTWLKDSGCTLWLGCRGYSEHVNWVYVNLTSKMFCPGISGIPVTEATCRPCNHHRRIPADPRYLRKICGSRAASDVVGTYIIKCGLVTVQ